MQKEGPWSEGIYKYLLIFILPAFIFQIHYRDIHPHFTFCLFKNILGRECWGCGTLRNISVLLHGDFSYFIWKWNAIVIPFLAWIYLKNLISLLKYFGIIPNPMLNYFRARQKMKPISRGGIHLF